MALEAVDIGLGVCHIWGAIIAMNGNKDLLSKLELPERFAPCCTICIGKTDEKYEAREIPKRIETVRMA